MIVQEDFSRKSTPVLRPAKQSKLEYWIQKNFEVFEEIFIYLWIVSRRVEFDKWSAISNMLKLYMWYLGKLVEEYFKRDPFFYSFGPLCGEGEERYIFLEISLGRKSPICSLFLRLIDLRRIITSYFTHQVRWPFKATNLAT